jgi:hypothetical protein
MVGHTLVAGGSSVYRDRLKGRSPTFVSAMTPYQGDVKPALGTRAVSADSVHAPSALGDDTAIRTIKHKIAKAATGIGGLLSLDDR